MGILIFTYILFSFNFHNPAFASDFEEEQKKSYGTQLVPIDQQNQVLPEPAKPPINEVPEPQNKDIEILNKIIPEPTNTPLSEFGS